MLACGYEGKGKLEDVETIIESVRNFFNTASSPMDGKNG